jgi:hypothetical protein
VVLIELEERHVESDLGHRPSYLEEFLLAPIHPLWLPFSVIQLVSEPVWLLVSFNKLCD